MSEFVCPRCGVSLIVSAKPEQPKKALSLEDVTTLFPADLERLLTFAQAETSIIIKPKRFLGTDSFAKIAHIVRSNGGEYISAGKESHFRIPTKEK